MASIRVSDAGRCSATIVMVKNTIRKRTLEDTSADVCCFSIVCMEA